MFIGLQLTGFDAGTANLIAGLGVIVGTTAIGKPKIPKGFKQTKQFGYQHGQKVYEYNGKYYSRDMGSGNARGSHNGGVWKVFELKNGELHRIGTADANLNIFKK